MSSYNSEHHYPSSSETPLTPRFTTNLPLVRHLHKRIKLSQSMSKLETTISSLSHSTTESLYQAELAKQQLEELRSSYDTLKDENRSLRAILQKERTTHKLVMKDLEISQQSVRRLRNENIIYQRKNEELKSEVHSERRKAERAREKLENEMKDHLGTSQALIRAREEAEHLKEKVWMESIKIQKLKNNEKGMTALEKENKVLLRRMIVLEDELARANQHSFGGLYTLKPSVGEKDELIEEEDEKPDISNN